LAIFVRSGGILPSFKLPQLPTHIKVDMFFDRSAVKNALSNMEYKGLTRSSLLVRRTAQKSIQKKGMAKPLLKEQKANPGMGLDAILRTQKLSVRRQSAIVERIREIKTRPPSSPGSPPNTHVPFGHMLGFRRNLYNAYDKTTHSAVVGPSMKGPQWTIPQLHEFGGGKTLTAWVWKPQYPRYRKPIIRWVAQGDTPGAGWLPTGGKKRASYPPRPYMRPALDKSRPQFAKFFEGAFSAGVYGGS
jgi:hypothetical protein